MPSFDEFLGSRLAQQRSQHRYRSRLVLEGPQEVSQTVHGRRFLAFSSNDYLGLANHPEVRKSFKSAAEQFGVGSGASHLICGHSSHHHALEEELAAFTGRSRALLFSTGYMANMGVIDALTGKGDTVFQDRLNHASLIDGGRLTRASGKRYRNESLEQLSASLQSTAEGRKLIATDGVFSMDGNLAGLPALATIAKTHNAILMVDDAHGFGVLGKRGGGCAEHYNLTGEDIPVLVGTLGKAFGTFGAFVAGSDNLVEYLIQYCRTYIYTTALPAAVAAATRTSLKLLQEESWRREKLQHLVSRFRRGAADLGLEITDSLTPIQPVILGTEATTMAVAGILADQGILVGAIRPPTVPEGAARLRVTFSAEHTDDQVDKLVEAISGAVKEARASREVMANG